ncbi:glutathione S-transferase [Sporormia fimetaria CBS 119925]|uniref:Glutathione S-transferase n=1 Tax=Sporormia fimetaria CBS 119925 TaxID=1340428 RepID=A0A6A6UY00_9PLEO|nr:glutathione S-transferase [Sporormia fimetaria CBS 119925]
MTDASQNGNATKKTYHKKATGDALLTVEQHSKEEDLQIYGSCFCPFVQRAWISLEHKGIPYQYIEVDPYKKPKELTDINPRGLVPAIRHGPSFSMYESTVIMEYFEDLGEGSSLFPPDAQTKAICRLWTDYINRIIVPGFYRLLQAQEEEKQLSYSVELRDAINKLVEAANSEGPFFLGNSIGFVDVQMAPWVVRLRKVLGPYRGWPNPEPGTRWCKWVEAIENDKSVKATTSDDGLYLDSYERYAENRPNTSQVAQAVNEGRGLP